MTRWTFPLVPDDNHPGGHLYEHLRGNKYIAKDNSVSLSRYVVIFGTAVLSGPGVLTPHGLRPSYPSFHTGHARSATTRSSARTQ